MQEDQYYSQYLAGRFSPATGQTELVNFVVEAEPPEPMRMPRGVHPNKDHSYTGVHVNDLLPAFLQISAELNDAGIEIADTFGSTSQDPVIPDPFVVTIEGRPDPDILRKVISVCSGYGLQTVARARRNMFGNRIYVGSYANTNVGSTPNIPLIQKLKDSELTIEQIYALLPSSQR